MSLALRDGLVLVAEGHRRDDGAEDLLAHGGRVGVDVGEQRRLDEVAAERPGRGRRRRPRWRPGPARRSRMPVTLANCCALASGPISVAASSGLPRTISRARAATRSTSSSWTSSWTISREPAMHVWPVAAKTPAMTPLAAASRSASGKTTWADLPPSSSVTRARWLVGALGDVDAGLRRAGERDLVDARVAHQRAPDRGPVAGDDVEDAVRDARLGDELGELERGHRRVVARLDDHRAAGRPARARASR